MQFHYRCDQGHDVASDDPKCSQCWCGGEVNEPSVRWWDLEPELTRLTAERDKFKATCDYLRGMYLAELAKSNRLPPDVAPGSTVAR